MELKGLNFLQDVHSLQIQCSRYMKNVHMLQQMYLYFVFTQYLITLWKSCA